MPDFEYIYNNQAEQYQQMVDCEDYQGNLLPAIQAILPLEELDIIETGAGTGRLTGLLAPAAHAIYAFDRAIPMLKVAHRRIEELGLKHVHLAAADHSHLPAAEARADLLVAGWSVCYVYLEGGTEWRSVLKHTLAGFRHYLRPGGKLIVIETLGTGFEEPQRLPLLSDYLDFLEDSGFQMSWVRTDYRFESLSQARERIPFFFGEEMLEKLQGNILAECTGLWWQ
jgi:ubiquinone/menaquinone biosynthesis C-methylase UbiE